MLKNLKKEVYQAHLNLRGTTMYPRVYDKNTS